MKFELLQSKGFVATSNTFRVEILKTVDSVVQSILRRSPEWQSSLNDVVEIAIFELSTIFINTEPPITFKALEHTSE